MSAHPYEQLGPDQVMDAIDATGRRCSGHLLALNSYENRVYQVGIEDAEPLIAKFYRPDRWSRAQIQEEHDFSFQLLADEVPLVAPLQNEAGESLFETDGFLFTLFPRKGGHAPSLDNPDHLMQLGRLLARLHNRGAAEPFAHRPAFEVQDWGDRSLQDILDSGQLPMELQTQYQAICRPLIEAVRLAFADVSFEAIRLHGDCHPGNILWRDEHVWLVDLDDARMGPAIQDLWMFLSGDRAYRQERLLDIVEGYEEFRELDHGELALIEPLRALRMIHYTAWLCRRWRDPAFPQAFPWFAELRYWEEQILALKEQLANLEEPLLRL